MPYQQPSLGSDKSLKSGIMHANLETGANAAMITKRLVGIALALLGLAMAGGAVAVDLVGAGKWNGLGPAQQAAIVVGAVVCLVGLSLIPLGDRPA